MDATLAAFCCLIVAGSAALPAEVTEEHLRAIGVAKNISGASAVASKEELIKQLNSTEFRERIAVVAPELLRYSGEQLHQLLHDEYQVTEVCHNWEPMRWGGVAADLSLNSTIGQPFFYNQWQLASLGFIRNYPPSYTNIAEMSFYHLNNFSSPTGVPSFKESSERLIYGATNLLKVSTGNRLFGGVTMVLNNSHIRDYTVVGGVDTGFYEAYCNTSTPPVVYKPNCSAVGSVGTFDNWEGNLLSLAGFWLDIPRVVSGTETDVLSYLVGGMLQTHYDHQPNVTESLLYNEANPLMNLRYPEGVKMIILDVTDNMFGSYIGAQLQQWAITNNWVLSWAYSNLTVIGPSSQANKRFLDPFVLQHITAGDNVTSDSDFGRLLSIFSDAWTASNASLSHHINDTKWQTDQLTRLWSNINGTILRVQPLFRYACEDPSCAAVRVIDNKCVCS